MPLVAGFDHSYHAGLLGYLLNAGGKCVRDRRLLALTSYPLCAVPATHVGSFAKSGSIQLVLAAIDGQHKLLPHLQRYFELPSLSALRYVNSLGPGVSVLAPSQLSLLQFVAAIKPWHRPQTFAEFHQLREVFAQWLRIWNVVATLHHYQSATYGVASTVVTHASLKQQFFIRVGWHIHNCLARCRENANHDVFRSAISSRRDQDLARAALNHLAITGSPLDLVRLASLGFEQHRILQQQISAVWRNSAPAGSPSFRKCHFTIAQSKWSELQLSSWQGEPIVAPALLANLPQTTARQLVGEDQLREVGKSVYRNCLNTLHAQYAHECRSGLSLILEINSDDAQSLLHLHWENGVVCIKQHYGIAAAQPPYLHALSASLLCQRLTAHFSPTLLQGATVLGAAVSEQELQEFRMRDLRCVADHYGLLPAPPAHNDNL